MLFKLINLLVLLAFNKVTGKFNNAINFSEDAIHSNYQDLEART